MKSAGLFKIFPLFLSALCYASGVFSVFSAFPLMVASLAFGRAFMALAVVTNTALVIAMFDGAFRVQVLGYLVFGVVMAVSLSEFLARKVSLEKAVAGTLLVMILAGSLGLSYLAHRKGEQPLVYVRNSVSHWIDEINQTVPATTKQSLLGTEDPQEIREKVLVEFPSALAIFSLLLTWVNLLMVLRFNFGAIRKKLGIDQSMLKLWKAPEFLVWPTIVAGATLLFDVGWISNVGLNVFRFLMAIYCIQGMSILAFYFDHWKIRGLFRSLGFLFSVFFLLPLVLSLGFFDLWFDFRRRLRQS